MFVDVDYKPLMESKRDIIRDTSQLRSCLNSAQFLDDGNEAIVLQSDEYIGIGCDLKDLQGLEKSLKAKLDISKYMILFAAEVSITYMETETANTLLAWAARLSEGELQRQYPGVPSE